MMVDCVRKAAIYTRVSTSEQDPVNQLTPLVKWAEGLGYRIMYRYCDVMSGGASDRPEFRKMLSDARRGFFDVLLFWSLDRFSREGIRHTLKYLEQLRSYNVVVKSYTESWLDTSEEGMGNLLIAIFSWMAERERQRISERTKAGLERAVNVGKRGKDKKKRKRRSK